MDEFLRLDVALTQQGLAPSRSKGEQMIKNGMVQVNGRICTKPSYKITACDTLTVEQQERFVSRGGYKLLKALETFPISLQQAVCMDVGASTGGFTHCMLQFGAKTVYAVDVGTNQLASALREDSRVVVREQCNFRYITNQQIPQPIDFAGVDVSFISLTHILPVLYNLLKAEGQCVCLIKPQFEAGPSHVGKNGVVKDRTIHKQVIEKILTYAVGHGFSVMGLTHSPIKGPKGNIEYLIWMKKEGCAMPVMDIDAMVRAAHKDLDGDGK